MLKLVWIKVEILINFYEVLFLNLSLGKLIFFLLEVVNLKEFFFFYFVFRICLFFIYV